MRTDIHSPKNLITEDYEYFGSGYFGSSGEPGFSPLNTPYGQKILSEGWHFAENESAGACYHCGAHLKYYAILFHKPTHTLVRVGETCLSNRFDRASADFHALRKQAQLDRQAFRIRKLRNRWFAVDPDRELAYLWASERVEQGDYGWEGTRHKFISKIDREGETSDKFVRFIMRDMARTERFEEEREARERDEAETASPVIEGKVRITGTVLSVQWRDNQFGGGLKMLVRDDRGFKVWGSVPRALDAKRNERVSFTATITKSDDDETFGFFSRPTKAELLS